MTNLNSYLEIATEAVEGMLCSSLRGVTEARTFDIRDGYRTAFVDLFTAVTSVSLNGVAISSDAYSKRQWNKRQGSWYNALLLDRMYTGEITVTADWGFTTNMPLDLQKLIANAFAEVSKKNKSQRTSGIASKQVEDFRITYRTDLIQDDLFIQDNAATIAKYSMCGLPNVKHGQVC